MTIYGLAYVSLQKILAYCLQSSRRFTVQITGRKRPLRSSCLANASHRAFVSFFMESKTVEMFLDVCLSSLVQWPPKPDCS